METQDTKEQTVLYKPYYQVKSGVILQVGWDLHATPKPNKDEPIFASLEAAINYAVTKENDCAF